MQNTGIDIIGLNNKKIIMCNNINMKKYIYSTLSVILGALIFGVIGLLKFMNYGGNSCDFPGKNCGCFCCNLFGLRGYEACGNFGLLAGIILGAIIGFVTYKLIKSKF
ncbi:TPA: hypothetical protein DCZ46_02975 [Candidatus Campbellbacteria bacterium]|uniref:Uncharacterized protein n=2 Tax=Candidatus Campbelliibacteriota TaxID=1752727 RepID=A0A1F5ENN8_9BACT|nr:MAG: protein of unknown function with transmembrane region [Candidatus Campbellbacteria bacterium GW2011_OD1_34_28]KKP74910.1 MAG: hypothetical protein UR74_C0002G0176 [Candidatus Campbellbacteria bacterium GW2011_GWD2_35_24]KKP75796.1 MAG: hypothetical protein UR75_C0002G0177 [Candidatus Campbellbacteria bacterium GW2011_GWC2_35_28]KKP76956.1 MAG: hypothetical protein UR76_C0002G0157 [Candidatus Campbellbacteria bacterium GW2011_GWC1_35_31]KKP78882.1 MAG: hypothetical protein UR79_C0002G015